jgi:hypothetical protein
MSEGLLFLTVVGSRGESFAHGILPVSGPHLFFKFFSLQSQATAVFWLYKG